MIEAILILFCVLAFLPAVVSLFTYALFWYETASGPYLETFRRMSGGRVKWWIARGIVSSFLSSLFVMATFPCVFLRSFRNPGYDPTCSLPPVILVHGLYHNASAWILFRRRLKVAGFRNVYTLNYSSFRTSFPELLARLDALISDVTSHFPDQQVLLVGHSLGGLLAYAYCLHHPASRKIAGLATLGTPFHGSRVAALGPGKLAQSIIFHGPLSEEINTPTAAFSFSPLALYSPVDNMVLPFEALVPKDRSWRHELTPPVSHVAMLYHAGTASKVIQYLNECCESFVPVDCATEVQEN